MGAKTVKAQGLTDSGAKLIVWATAASCAGFLLALPRPVAPRGLPPLVLDAASIADVERVDRLAAQADADPTLTRVETLYRQWGEAEAGGDESFAVSRRAAMRAAVASLLNHAGEAGLRRMRARMLARLPGALAGDGDAGDDAALLGAFPRMLARYGLSRGGELTGPPFVIRTLYAARLNLVLGLPATAGFARIEHEAYWGWLALGDHEANVARRMEALTRYEEAREMRMPAARAALLYEAGQGAAAARVYQAAYERTGNLRLRNHALAAAQLDP